MSLSNLGSQLSQDQVVERLRNKFGIELQSRALLNYEQAGLINPPERGGFGRGLGKWTSFSEEAVLEAALAHAFIHGKYGNKALRSMFDDKMPRLTLQWAALARDVFTQTMAELGHPANRELFYALITHDSLSFKDRLAKNTDMVIVRRFGDGSAPLLSGTDVVLPLLVSALAAAWCESYFDFMEVAAK